MRESKTLEFKANIDTNTYLKTISAYANYATGDIIFGITDDGEVVGVNNPEEACLNIENKINDNIKPVPEYTLKINADATITLTIKEGQYKPYVYRGKAYKRSDTSTVEVERLEYNRLALIGSNLNFEDVPANMQDLTFLRLEYEFIRTMGIEAINPDILKTLALYSEKHGYNNAAAIIADQNDFKGIDIIRFGDSIDEIMDRETYENVSVLTQYANAMVMYRKYYQYEKIEGSERITIQRIPEKAFREAIANALVHRTWDVPAHLKISMHPDRIEISSPGGLPVGMSEDAYLNGQVSILRNPIIGNIFFRLKYIETFGTGVLRINRAYEDSIEKPVFKIYESSISVTLPAIKLASSLSECEKIVFDLLKGRGEMNRAEIEKASGFNKDKVIRILNNLLEKKAIKKSGRARAVKYSVA